MSEKLKLEILAKIRSSGTKPRPKWHFLALRWAIFGLIALIGIFSALIGTFLINDSLDLFRNGRNFGGFSPYFPWLIWGSALIVSWFLGIWFVRKTPTGYRYAFAIQWALWMLAIAILATTMRASWLWPAFHAFLLERAPMATEAIYGVSSWNNVANGRIAGTIRANDGFALSVECLDGEIRALTVTTSTEIKSELAIGTKIRGMVRTGENGSLIAEKILPWFGQGRKNKKSE